MDKSRNQKSFVNVSFGLLSQCFAIILNFVARTIFIKCLSAEYLGINGLFTNVLTVLSFVELGIGDAIVFSMYKPMKDKDIHKLHALMNLYKKMYRIIALVVGVLGLLLVFFIDLLIKERPGIHESLQVIFLLYILNTVISYLFAYKKSILLVDQKNYIISICQQAFFAIQLVLQTIVLLTTRNFYMYLVSQVLCTFLNNVVISGISNKFYTYIKGNVNSDLSRKEKDRIYSDVKALSISKVAGVVANGTDNIIISKLFGLTSVGLVSNYTLIINAINGIIWSGLSGLTGSIGNFNVDAEIDRRKNVFNQLFLCSFWFYGFACICLLILLNPFIILWIGENYSISDVTIFALVLLIYVGGANYPAYAYRTTLGYFNEVKYYYVLSAVLNLILSIIFGRIFGLCGVFFATSISRLCTSEIADGYYIYKLGFKEKPIKYFIKYYLYFGILIVNYLITKCIVSLILIEGVLGFMLKTMVCVLLSNGIFYIVFSKTKVFLDLSERVKQLKNNYKDSTII